MRDVDVIRTTPDAIPSELRRRGIGPDESVVMTVEVVGEIIPGRREARVRVVAAGLSDDDIDRLIKEAQAEVEHIAR